MREKRKRRNVREGKEVEEVIGNSANSHNVAKSQ